MKTLYLDCGMGAAGDMLTAALLELLPDPDGFVKELNALGIPGVEYVREQSEKCGIQGTHMSVLVHGMEEHEHMHEQAHEHDHEHNHNHEHEPEHEHHHSGLHEIEHIVGDLHLPEHVKKDVLSVYRLIAEAEGHVHGKPIMEIHFHEVGTLDAVADVAAVCLLMDRIAPGEVIASPVHVGSGTVRCAHGILPVPAPAAAYLLRGIPMYGGAVEGELCTPTGAALLKHFVTRFGEMPLMTASAIGYGIGKKDFPRANCLRAVLGETDAHGAETIVELDCNVDDMTAEELSFAMGQLLENGAREVFTAPVTMKKSRPGTLLTVLCAEADRDRMVQLMFRYTSTIGLRETVKRRYVLDRRERTAETAYGSVRVKESAGYGVRRVKYEYEDLSRVAREQSISIAEAREALAGTRTE